MASNPHLFRKDGSAFSFEQADVRHGDGVSEQEMFKNCGSEKDPALFEDFRSYLAREGGIDYNWICDILDTSAPASDEDFVAYFARSSGIIDTHTISELRRVLKSETHIPPCSNLDPPSYTVELPEEEEEDEEDESLIPIKCDENKEMSPFLQISSYGFLNSDVDQPTLGLQQQPEPHSLDEMLSREWQGLNAVCRGYRKIDLSFE